MMPFDQMFCVNWLNHFDVSLMYPKKNKKNFYVYFWLFIDYLNIMCKHTCRDNKYSSSFAFGFVSVSIDEGESLVLILDFFEDFNFCVTANLLNNNINTYIYDTVE